MMSLRLTPALHAMLVRVADKLPATTPHAVARLALRLGLEKLAKGHKK